MRTLDFAPLYRSTVGFDRLFDMIDRAAKVETTAAWPPYNIEKAAYDAYRITLAVAGFGPDEIELVQNNTTLLVVGQKKEAEDARQFLHRGIASRQFRQTFDLAEHVRVTGAKLENGLLTIDLLQEVPEALKPRQIPIGSPMSAPGQDNSQLRVESRRAA